MDATGYYDDNEVERVVTVELDPRSSQGQLAAALEPVADRLLKRYKALKDAIAAAQSAKESRAEKQAKDEIAALLLFRHNLGAFQRVYAFLSQIFDYGNTAIEKRAIFFKRLLPLLAFGRQRDGVDLSSLTLTHLSLKHRGSRNLAIGEGDGAKLKPFTAPGGGEGHDKEMALLSEIIAKMNDLYEGNFTDGDKLVLVNGMIKEKLMESETLVQQAMSNTKKQFASSPDLNKELTNAIMDGSAAQSLMCRQALDSKKILLGLLDILLGPAELYEALRARGGIHAPNDMAAHV
jgi:type I restriction enzyme, R subunit